MSTFVNIPGFDSGGDRHAPDAGDVAAVLPPERELEETSEVVERVAAHRVLARLEPTRQTRGAPAGGEQAVYLPPIGARADGATPPAHGYALPSPRSAEARRP